MQHAPGAAAAGAVTFGFWPPEADRCTDDTATAGRRAAIGLRSATGRARRKSCPVLCGISASSVIPFDWRGSETTLPIKGGYFGLRRQPVAGHLRNVRRDGGRASDVGRILGPVSVVHRRRRTLPKSALAEVPAVAGNHGGLHGPRHVGGRELTRRDWPATVALIENPAGQAQGWPPVGWTIPPGLRRRPTRGADLRAQMNGIA